MKSGKISRWSLTLYRTLSKTIDTNIFHFSNKPHYSLPMRRFVHKTNTYCRFHFTSTSQIFSNSGRNSVLSRAYKNGRQFIVCCGSPVRWRLVPSNAHMKLEAWCPFYHDARHQEVEPMRPYEMIMIVLQTAMLVIQAVSLGSNNDSKNRPHDHSERLAAC